jgi:hypothetical protein
MADLMTLDTLARWTQRDVGEVYGDPFAADLVDKVSQLVCFIGGHDGSKTDVNGDPVPEWDLVSGSTQAPIDVQMVVLQVCKRSYENPGQVIQEGNIGPIGGDRVADVQALFLDLTDSERATIAKYNPDGDPDPTEGSGTVFVLSTTRGDETTLRSPLYVGDDQQIGLAESPDPREWKIPLFNPGDPGAIENYDEV